MYLRLFNRITDAIEALEHGDAAQAKAILIRAQQDAEQQYMESEEKMISQINKNTAGFL